MAGVALEFLPLVALVALYAAGRAVLEVRTGTRWHIIAFGVLRDSAYWFLVGGTIGLVGSTLQFVWRDWRRAGADGTREGAGEVGSRGPVGRWLRHLASRFGIARVAGAAAAVLLMVVFLQLFEAVKTAIPVIHPFSWDQALYHADRALALGHDPWRLLQPFLGHPVVTHVLDDGYAIWYVVIMGTLLWQCWSPRRGLRDRFLLAFVLCWAVLGSVLATLFSSAGPTYYGQVVGHPDPYTPLMDYLRRVDAVHSVTALKIQRYLWEGYTGVAVHSVQGISAMPSLHVSMAVLATLVAARYRRWLAVPFGAFTVLVFLGSIELAWHYAVDGYVAAVLTLGCWWAACWMLDRYEAATGRSAAEPGGSGRS